MDYRADIERALEVAPVLNQASLRSLFVPGNEIVVPTAEDLAVLQEQALEFKDLHDLDPDFMAEERNHEAQHAEANSLMGFESAFALRFNWVSQGFETGNRILIIQHFCQPLGRLTVAQHIASSIYPEVPSPADVAVANGNPEKAARRIQKDNTFKDHLPLPLWYKPAFRKLFF